MHSSNLCASCELKHLIKLFLSPRGGSKVIFIPFIKSVTGNTLLGIAVNHNLKSLLVS